jgi:quinol monooxygenase YgiN
MLSRYGAKMLIVAGSVEARPDSIDQLLALSLAHVRRSRRESGCLLHSVHRDAENPLRLVFLEHWVDVAALRAHFRVPESGAFVTEATGLAVSPPQMAIYEAHAISV